MDLDLAIWRLSPAATYRLTDDKTAVAEWRGPGKQPTASELQAAWDAYQAEQAAASSTKQVTDTERTAATTDLRSKAAAALTRLAALDTDPTTTDTAAKMQRAIRDLAQIVHAMLRHDLSQAQS